MDPRTDRASAFRADAVRALLTEPRRLKSIRERPDSYWYAVGAVCIGAFMGQLDASIVTIAFPSFERAFHSGVESVTWVGLAYLISLVAFVTIVGRFADMAGRKLLYVYGFGVFAVASAACGLAPDLPALVVLRVAQGVGAAMLQANSLAIIKLAAPAGRLARAIGVQGAAQALGLALGPSIGGALIAAGGWRLIFYVNVPVGIVGLAAGWFFIPRSRDLRPRAGLDWTGLIWFVPSIASLLVAITFGNHLGWSSAAVIVLFVVFAAFGAAFFLRERSARHPMVDLRLFSNRAFSSGIASALAAYLVTFGALLIAPFVLERDLGAGPSQAGLDLMVMPVALGAVALVAGRFADRVGVRVLTTTGMVIVAATSFVLALSEPTTGVVVGGLALIGAGFGCFTPSNNAATLATVPRGQSGEASGVVNVTRAIGTSLGLALTGLVFALGGGDHQRAASVVRGYHDALFFLAGVALVAAAIALARRSSPDAAAAARQAAPIV